MLTYMHTSGQVRACNAHAHIALLYSLGDALDAVASELWHLQTAWPEQAAGIADGMSSGHVVTYGVLPFDILNVCSLIVRGTCPTDVYTHIYAHV